MAVSAIRQFQVLPSAARTAAVNSADFTNPGGAKGLRVWVKVTVDPAAAAVTFTIQGKTQQGDYYTLLASAALAAVATTTLVIHPDIAASANVNALNVLPHTWRVAVTVADADSFTYSVGAEYLA